MADSEGTGAANQVVATPLPGQRAALGSLQSVQAPSTLFEEMPHQRSLSMLRPGRETTNRGCRPGCGRLRGRCTGGTRSRTYPYTCSNCK